MSQFRIYRTAVKIALRTFLTIVVYACVDLGEGFAEEDPERLLLIIPSGAATETVSALAREAETNIVFAATAPGGVITKEIHGLFTVKEALDRMLEDTPLVAVPVSGGKAFGIIYRAKKGGSLPNRSKTKLDNEFDEQTQMDLKKNSTHKKNGSLLKTLLALSVAGSATGYAQTDDEEDILTLSPFTVTAGEDTGYRATTTLAGSRLKTNLRDVGSAISVMTEEFFDDTGAVDAETVLSYALNADVSGPQGNFANQATARSRVDTTGLRGEPESNNQRIRGLASASLTRDYFLTDIAFDKYNTERVTINRGPNSLLFGVGSPGGVIDNALKKASTARNFGEVSVRLGERSSHRETFDFNRVLIQDRLALRVAGMNEETNYQQRPAKKESERIYANFQAMLFKNENSGFLGETRLSGHYEGGTSFGHPPNVVPPTDWISTFFEAPDRAQFESVLGPLPDRSNVNWIDNGNFQPKQTYGYGVRATDFVAARPPSFAQFMLVSNGADAQVPNVGQNNDLAGIIGAANWVASSGLPNYNQWGTISFESGSVTPGFLSPVITDRNVIDNQNLMVTGTTQTRETDFNAHNLTLQQSFWDGKAGLEIAYDEQSFYNRYHLPFTQDRASAVSIDVSEFLVNGLPNPNVGRPYIVQTNADRFEERWTDRSALRATAFYELDFTDSDSVNWLGKHTFTGFYSEQEADRMSLTTGYAWGDASGATDVRSILGQPETGFRRNVVRLNYVGPSLLDSSINSLSDVRLTQFSSSPTPQAGDVHRIGYTTFSAPTPVSDTQLLRVDDFEVINYTRPNGRVLSNNEITSEAISVQSQFFGGNIVGLYGLRSDESISRENDPSDLASSLGPALNPEEGDTTSWSIVAHQPSSIELPFGTEFSFHINKSENFSPSGARRNVFGEDLAPPTGNTEDIGFTIEMFDRKLVARVNWYEMQSSNSEEESAGAILGALTGGRLANSLRRWMNGEEAGISFADALAITDPDGVTNFQSYDEVYTAIRNSRPAEVLAIQDFSLVTGGNDSVIRPLNMVGTTDFVTEGVEIDVTGNITPNWQVAINVAQQKTTQSNVVLEMERLANLTTVQTQANGIWLLRDDPSAASGGATFQERWTNGILNQIAAIRAKEGTLSQEQREWRANVVTNYRFDDNSFLKGFSLGGAMRWQDNVATGYEIEVVDGLVIPQLDRPFLGPTETDFDLWFNYSRKITDDVRWKIQLNVRNVFADNDYIPVFNNPDGSIAVVRNPNPQEIFLTNTISF